jgi:hypothetical protein
MGGDVLALEIQGQLIMNHYAIDTETLGTTSTSVILSIALVPFDIAASAWDPVVLYRELLYNPRMWKLSVEDQVNNYQRTMDKDTLEWWSKQNNYTRNISFVPDPSADLTLEQTMDSINQYLFVEREETAEELIFWQRGTLDQVVLDGAARALGRDTVVPYSSWRDFRTAIECLYDDAKYGYRDVPGFDSKSYVYKHDPRHDCCFDILQMISQQ